MTDHLAGQMKVKGEKTLRRRGCAENAEEENVFTAHRIAKQ